MRARMHNTQRFAGVCREWRCKYEGDKATSASLEACSKVLDEYLPELKKIETRQELLRHKSMKMRACRHNSNAMLALLARERIRCRWRWFTCHYHFQ